MECVTSDAFGGYRRLLWEFVGDSWENGGGMGVNAHAVRLALAALLTAAAFAAGALWSGKVATTYQEYRDRASRPLPLPSVAISAAEPASALPQPSPPAARSREYLETALLPLLKDIVPLPAAVGIAPGNGGAIVVVGDEIIVVDHRGQFARVASKGDRIEKLALPELPSNRADYDRLAAPPRELSPGLTVNTGFTVHDAQSRREASGIRLYVSYERFLSELKTTALAVSAILLDSSLAPLGSWEDVYQGDPLQAQWYSGVAGGGRMLLRGDELLMTVGDYNLDNVFMRSHLEAQNPTSDLGKILAIDLRTKAKTILSMGHRNPEGLAMTQNGTIYATEHGPRGGDLLTRIVAGTNFGWPIVTLGTHYWSYQWPNRDAATGQVFDKPTFAWVPSIAVSNLMEVVGFHPAWNKDLLVESLKAQSLFRLRLDGDRVVYSEPIWIGERLRDIGSLPDGTLVLFTDSAKLIFLSIDTDKLATDKREYPPPMRPPQTGCRGCH
jgi:glucose/arabinose dehydrogenase